MNCLFTTNKLNKINTEMTEIQREKHIIFERSDFLFVNGVILIGPARVLSLSMCQFPTKNSEI